MAVSWQPETATVNPAPMMVNPALTAALEGLEGGARSRAPADVAVRPASAAPASTKQMLSEMPPSAAPAPAPAEADAAATADALPDAEDVPLSAFSVGEPLEAVTGNEYTRKRRRLEQRRAKVLRILKEAGRIHLAEAQAQQVAASGGLGNFQTLVRVAADIRRAADALHSCDLLRELGEIQLAMMASAGKRRTHKRYTKLYREGAPAAAFYILKSGTVQETSIAGVDTTTTVERRPDAKFVLLGMESLLGRPRQSTLSCLEDVEIIKFSAVDLNVKEEGAAKVARKVFESFVSDELSHMPLFRTISPKQLKQILPLFALEEAPAGKTIFNMGAPGDKVYILLHGSCQMIKGREVLQTMRAEQGQASTTEYGLPVFGEMALLDRKPRIAAAVAMSDCKLLVLPHEQFAASMLIVPDIKARLRKLKEIRRRENEAAEKKRAAEAAHAERMAQNTAILQELNS